LSAESSLSLWERHPALALRNKRAADTPAEEVANRPELRFFASQDPVAGRLVK